MDYETVSMAMGECGRLRGSGRSGNGLQPGWRGSRGAGAVASRSLWWRRGSFERGRQRRLVVRLEAGSLVSAVVAFTVGCSTAHAQAPAVAFEATSWDPGGRFDFVLAVADLNGDGRNDILVGGHEEYNVAQTPEERLTKSTLGVFVNQGDGTFRHAPELVEGAFEARSPIAVVDDFNGDTYPDLAIFDYGVYIYDRNSGYGNPPQLFLGSHDGVFRASDALAQAVRTEHERQDPPLLSGPSDLHVKAASAGDIDADGDLDMWVQSGGGANVEEHFMVNNGTVRSRLTWTPAPRNPCSATSCPATATTGGTSGATSWTWTTTETSTSPSDR